MEQVTLKTVHEDLEFLKKAVVSMKELMCDCFLTSQEEENLNKAREEFKAGEVFSIEDLEQERNNA